MNGRLLHHHTEGGERGNDLGAGRGRSQGYFVFRIFPDTAETLDTGDSSPAHAGGGRLPD